MSISHAPFPMGSNVRSMSSRLEMLTDLCSHLFSLRAFKRLLIAITVSLTKKMSMLRAIQEVTQLRQQQLILLQ